METRIKRFKERFDQSPYRAIHKIFMGRLHKKLKPIQEKWDYVNVRFGLDSQARNLLLMQEHLNKLYTEYNWQKFEGKVTFIKTSQNKNWNADVWENLAQGGVKVVETEGNHYTIFEEPEAQGLAAKVQQCLNEAHQDLSSN